VIDKQVKTTADAVAGVRDGSTVLVAGFGAVGVADHLLDALHEQGARQLTIVANNSGNGDYGLARLIDSGRVRKVICSYPRSGDYSAFLKASRARSLELELVPQGTISERMRCHAAGLGGFFSPVSAGTKLAEGKETREIDGRLHVFEKPLKGDIALLKANKADRWGNLTYIKSARNFNPNGRRFDRRGSRSNRGAWRDGSRSGGHPEHFCRSHRRCRSTGMTPKSHQPLTREQMAWRAAQDLPEGAYVNLGIGIPTLAASFVPPGREVIFHSENGILGMGPKPEPGKEDLYMVDAGKNLTTLVPGGCFVHHADAF
jgi:3-oxoadipate CoA-transferase alpha subunit